MDKNSIFGILIIAGILIVWGVIQRPNEKQLERNRKYTDSVSAVQKKALEAQEAAKFVPSSDSLKTETPTLDTAAQKRRTEELGVFATNAVGKDELYTIENDIIKLTVSSKGGRPYSVELKKYKTFSQDPIVLFNGDSSKFGLTFYDQNRPISTNDLYFNAKDSLSHDATVKNDSITMRLSVSEGRYIEYRYTLKPGSYMIDFSLNLVGMNTIGTRDPNALDLSWEIFIPQHEQLKKNENQYTSLYYRHYKDNVDFFRARQSKSTVQEDIPTQVEWVAFKNQFFSSVIIAESAFSSALLKSTNLPETDKYLKNFRAELGVPFQRLDNETIHMKMFFGPNKFKLLKKYKVYKLEDLVSVGRGMIRWINQYVIIPIFDWLSKYMGNFGIIILLLTIIIKIGLLPLTYRSYLSQARMKVLKPQIDELNVKFPKGKEMEKQQATMALYKKAGISPLGGCLPMLLQFPILFAMFRFFPTSIELRQESFLWAHDLSTYDAIVTWSGKIPILSYLFGNHISLFTLLMTVSTIIQMKMSDTSASTQQMPGMKSMMYIMPIMFLFMLNNFSSGLTYYYFLTNVITIGQNYLFKQFVDEKDILKKIEERKAKPVKKSKWQQRIENMAKQQQIQRKPTKKK
jgi:YidC/Oxa1 family membrane protein insertase